jgi:hypothetical protein
MSVTSNPSYATSDDVIQIFGLSNVITWSNLDGTSNSTTQPNLTRVQYWLNYAAAKIARMWGWDGNAQYPVQFSGYDIATVAVWCATLAGIGMYFARGVLRDQETDDKMMRLEKKILDEMAAARGQDRAQVIARWAQPTSPIGYPVNGIGGMCN